MTAYVGLGSNLGDSEATLARAVEGLAALEHCELAAVSPVYRTEPQGFKDQPWFHNQVAALRMGAQWTPQALLQALLELERRMGRERPARADSAAERFGPRVIDLDLLLFGELTLETAELSLPHPRMRERAFVLVPLADVAPGLVFPDGQPLHAALEGIGHHVQEDTICQD